MNIVLIVAFAGLVILLVKRDPSTFRLARKAKPAALNSVAMTGQGRAKSPYRAVSIKAPGAACAAAKELEGRRFLLGDVPLTPLPGCTNARCECRYVHYQDRRNDQDRRDPSGFDWRAREPGEAVNRRAIRPRRKSDDLADQRSFNDYQLS